MQSVGLKLQCDRGPAYACHCGTLRYKYQQLPGVHMTLTIQHLQVIGMDVVNVWQVCMAGTTC